MTAPWGKLRIDVVDDEIIVSLPGTSYTVTYYKPPKSPQLLAKRIAKQDIRVAPTSLSEFLAPRHGPILNLKVRSHVEEYSLD